MARIAFLIPDMGGGGAERVALSLIEGFVAAGHEVDLLLLQRRGALLPLVPGGVRIVDLAAPRLRHALLPLIRYLRAARPDAMQVSMWPLTIVGILAATLARTGTRVVTSDHSTLSQQYAGRSRTLRFLRWSTAAFYPRAAAVIAVSQGTADDLAALSGLPACSIAIVPNPVPVPPPDPPADRATAPAWKGVTHRILAVGSLKPEKNFALFLDALAQVDPALDWQAVILGEGPLRSALEEKARVLGLSERVAMPGFVTDPAPWYRTASHFVLSSDFEGLPSVLIEALHAGLTIVSTDCKSGPREILGAKGGLLVPVANTDALASALVAALQAPADPVRQRALGKIWSGATAVDQYMRLMGLAAPDAEPRGG